MGKKANWRDKDRFYGPRVCKYAEFYLPDLPALVSAELQFDTMKLPSTRIETLVEEEEVPEAALWHDKYQVRADAKARRELERKREVFRAPLPETSSIPQQPFLKEE